MSARGGEADDGFHPCLTVWIGRVALAVALAALVPMLWFIRSDRFYVAWGVQLLALQVRDWAWTRRHRLERAKAIAIVERWIREAEANG